MEQRGRTRNPVMWLVIGLPILAVVAGVGLVVIALRSGGDDAVIDTVQRTAQIQTTELGPDERAREMKLSAVLRVDRRGVELLPVDGGFGDGQVPRDVPLTLALSHPSQATQDRTLELRPSELGWHADVDLPLDHDWLLQLTPNDRQWRLHGRLVAGQQAAHLAPALAGE
ncbi:MULTISPECIES: FixH family protein [unclassified Lysobacter]|uniref:FixH family protein n=1 Tax=unclassified Lysobacter TaxID=2635362 RepID=UPI001C238450|nr:FixH family protein [Lysobacter sp. MMG2]MBU8975798.1 FixH family protein [Lysobacter sp. MMG2]